MTEAAAETTAPAKEKGERRSARGSTRQDTERSATTQQVRAERAGDQARGAKAEAAANRERRQRERETARGEAAGKIEKLAARMKLDLAANLRDTRKAETLREEWRWKIVPEGEDEQLVLFNHAATTGETDWEIRAAVLRSAYGRGLVYTCTAKCNQALGHYGGESISLKEYWQLHEDNGLRHTLMIGGKWVNGYRGVTGMQYANTSRGGTWANNAHFAENTATVRRGQPVLLPYGWTASAWKEIESGVVGMCAYEERGESQGLGREGGTYVIELVASMRRGGIGTQMLRETRVGWARGRGIIELQVHNTASTARRYYERLGFRKCGWRDEATWTVQSANGGSMYAPMQERIMMQAQAAKLESELEWRATSRGGTTPGIVMHRVQGVQGLEDMGLLEGARAMAARVYATQEWWQSKDRVACLYERAPEHAVHFIVAVRDGGGGWRSFPEQASESDDQDTGTAAGHGGERRTAPQIEGRRAGVDARANGPEAGGEDTEGKGAEGGANTQKGRKRAAGEMGQTLDRWLRREGAEEGRGRGAGVRRKTMDG